ncbi:MAG: transaldolase family protein [Gemmatimonas sp.]
MKLYLATDALDDVRWASERALIDGVVLPDAALQGASSENNSLAWLDEFARAVGMPVFVALNGTAAAEAEAEAARLGRASEHVVVQLPFAEPYIPLMHRLATSGVKIAATFVGSTSQAMLAARTGVAYVFIDVGRLDAGGQGGAAVIVDARRMLDASPYEADLVAVFPSPGAPMVACALAGADAAVLGAAALRASLAYPFTDSALMESVRRPVAGERLRVTP